MEIPFVGQSYATRSTMVSAQSCVNWYLENGPQGGRTSAALYPTPGLEHFATLPADAQALRAVDGRLFAVCNGALLEVSQAGVVTSLGVVPSTGTARLLDNGVQLLILTGLTAHCLTLSTNTLSAIAAPEIQTALQATVIDGYGIFCEPGSGRVRITGIYDFTTVDPLDFASAEARPDDLVTCERLNRELWLFGDRSTEIWFNSGAADFPFERNGNTFIEFGLAAVNTSALLDGALYWLGRGSDGRVTVLRASGYQPELIAHHGISEELERAERNGGIADAWAYSYKERGHPFYVLTLPSIKKTFCFDPIAQAWHERSSEVSNQNQHHLARHCVTIWGKTIVSVRTSPVLAEMREGAYTDLGTAIHRSRVCPVIHAQQKKMNVSALELIAEAGIGTATGQGQNPILQMRQSTDGGRSWGDWRQAEIGRIGEYSKRVVFRRLGQAVNRVIEVRCSDPVPVTILGASVDAQVSR